MVHKNTKCIRAMSYSGRRFSLLHTASYLVVMTLVSPVIACFKKLSNLSNCASCCLLLVILVTVNKSWATLLYMQRFYITCHFHGLILISHKLVKVFSLCLF